MKINKATQITNRRNLRLWRFIRESRHDEWRGSPIKAALNNEWLFHIKFDGGSLNQITGYDDGYKIIFPFQKYGCKKKARTKTPDDMEKENKTVLCNIS